MQLILTQLGAKQTLAVNKESYDGFKYFSRKH
jgi:hypothetical protein